ncbi:MAG TPA: hypothetical protein VNZ45_00645 [Bacteroidia bacterium]|jgi:hypothetical protein|nr:hypothetical protein [Bacteroidia bacterium]
MKTIKLALATLLVAGLGLLTVNAQNVAPAKGTTQKAPATSGQHLKKDGTPDMRYKENKTTAGKTTVAKPAAKTTEAKPATDAKPATKSTKASGSKSATKKAAAGTTK